MDIEEAVVIDLGSAFIKSGIAGDDAPRSCISTAVGRQTHQEDNVMADVLTKDLYVGDEAQSRRGILSMEYPMSRGIVTNWDDMEVILNHIFYNELSRAPDENNLLLTEPPMNPKFNKEMMAKVMFEYFDVPGLFVCQQGRLSCYASGRGSALIVDIGDGVTHVTPIYEGYCPQNAIRRVDFGGHDLTTNLQSLLHERGVDFVTESEFQNVRSMKEKLCYVTQDFKEELHKTSRLSGNEKSYELPDGAVVTLGQERFRCPEILFDPWKDLGSGGIQELVHSSLMACDTDIRRDLFCNIILSGGSTMLEGFPERLQKEINALAAKTMKVKVISPPERKYSVWIGGSIVASLSTFQQQWITKQEYEEYGPEIIHKTF